MPAENSFALKYFINDAQVRELAPLFNVDLCWSMFINDDQCWSLMISVGQCWSMLVNVDGVDQCSSVLTSVDKCWSIMTNVDHWRSISISVVHRWCWWTLTKVDQCESMVNDAGQCWSVLINADQYWSMLLRTAKSLKNNWLIVGSNFWCLGLP